MSWIYVGAASGFGVAMGAGLELIREWLGMKWQHGTAVEGCFARTLPGCSEQQQQHLQEQQQQQQDQQQQQQQAGTCFVTLPNNILQDIASRLNGWSLLALLCTCRNLRNSQAVRACLFAAVRHQLTALHAALQTRLQGVHDAEGLLQLAQSIRDASDPQLVASPAQQKQEYVLGYELRNDEQGRKETAMVDLLQIKASLQRVDLLGPPQEHLHMVAHREWQPTVEQHAPLCDQIVDILVVAARKEAVAALQLPQPLGVAGPGVQRTLLSQVQFLQAGPGQQADLQHMQQTLESLTRGLQAGQQLRRAQQLQQQVTAVQRAYQLGPAGQQQQLTQPQLHQMRDALQLTDDYLEVNERLQRKLQEAIDALQAGPAEQQTSDEVFHDLDWVQGAVQDGLRGMLRWALYSLVRGEPQAGAALQLVQQLRAGDLTRMARAILQQTVRAGEEALQTRHVGVVALREAVQRGQEALQGSAD